MVISGDGSAAIDGEPVPSADGVTIDAAILNTLHGYARDRGTTVTATVSDPSAGYVAFVEVAPDGSGAPLVDQREQPPGTAAAQPASGPAPTPGVEEPPEPAKLGQEETGPAGDDDGLVTGSEDDSAEGFTGEFTEEAAADETLDEDFDGALDTDDRDRRREPHGAGDDRVARVSVEDEDHGPDRADDHDGEPGGSRERHVYMFAEWPASKPSTSRAGRQPRPPSPV